MTNDYAHAIEFLLSLPDAERGTGRHPGREEIYLERPAALLNALGKPQARFRSILIAGTKGKGSTAAMLESILRAAGLKTGLYTSPHLHTYRERIRVNGELISEIDFARGVGEIQSPMNPLLAQHSDFESFTTFEVMTALALNYFARAQVDTAILEVGLGGRLDATNVVDADLSLITPISFDHTAVLGNTLPKIAFEKAGIIKAGKIVLSAPQAEEAMNVLQHTAREKNATLGIGEHDWLWLGGHGDFMVAARPREGLWSEFWEYHDLQVPLLGVHQLGNAGLAVAAAQVVQSQWCVKVSDTAVREGLSATKWAGRLEVLQAREESQPLIVADGAHNGDSAEKLFHALKFHFEYDKLFLIFGVLSDKELEAIARPFAGTTEFAWTVKTKHARSRDAAQIAARLSELGILANAASDFSDALEGARARASPRDLILITGSLSLVAEAREFLGGDKTKKGE